MKTKSSLVLCISTIWLFGCATPADLRTKTPSLELTSSRPAKPVAICIVERWENFGILGTTIPVNMRPTTDGYTVSWRNEAWGHTGLLADVSDVLNGSTTRYFKNLVLSEGSFDNAVKECQ
jgi:hypothetical protein